MDSGFNELSGIPPCISGSSHPFQVQITSEWACLPEFSGFSQFTLLFWDFIFVLICFLTNFRHTGTCFVETWLQLTLERGDTIVVLPPDVLTGSRNEQTDGRNNIRTPEQTPENNRTRKPVSKEVDPKNWTAR